jgi:F-type H+-transporting ATPase subunit gamma
MAVPARIIRRRIKSVGNTKKITKAMELVSAAKMRRAVGLATNARRYAALGDELLKNLSVLGAGANHPFFRAQSESKKALCVVIASDRGLCGSYNVGLMRAVEAAMSKEAEVDYIAVGRQADLALRRSSYGKREPSKIIAAFPGLTDTPSAKAVRPLVSLVQSEFVSGSYRQVFIATTKFRSALRQEPIVEKILPLINPEISAVRNPQGIAKAPSGALFEPSPQMVLEYVLPRFMEASVYQAILEAAASEHSSRMMSMRNATDAAGEMMEDLTFTLNQARQSAITSEIAEISAGRAALEG